MCVDSVVVRNPAKFFSVDHCKRFYVRCRCGHCSECRRIKRLEWSLRSQYEFRKVLDSGHFVYYDTLTYSDESVPWLHDHIGAAIHTESDRMVFNRTHLRRFFTNLNRKLVYRGYDVKGRLSHFVSAEYAVDPFYSQRPHYHILLYVGFDINPLEFSRIVQDCWPYGHTDGLPFRNRRYVMDHDVISDSRSSNKVANYVSKYVLKPYSQTEKVVRAVKDVFRWLHPDQPGDLWLEVPYVRSHYECILRQVKPFFLVSPHFGEYALSLYDDLADTRSLPLVQSKGVKRVALPLYYFRKLFYDVVKDGDVRRWIPNDCYRHMRISCIDDDIRNRSLVYSSIYRSMSLNGDIAFVDYTDRLLDNRSFVDLARYEMFYKDRNSVALSFPIDFITQLQFDPVSYDRQKLVSLCFPLVYGYNTVKDKRLYGKRFFSFEPCDDGFVRAVPESSLDVINQDSLFDFRFFDKLLDFLIDYSYLYDKLKDRHDETVARIQEKYACVNSII